jgi:hypothetical protein
MAIPDPVTYADINAKILQVDNDMAAFGARQRRFVQDLNDMITYFVYSLRDIDVAAAVDAAAAAGEIDPAQGNAIYRKFMEVQEALRQANSDADKIAIIQSLRKWEPVLRKLPIGDAGYNGLPGQMAVAPDGYPVGAAPRGARDDDAGTGLGPPGAGFGAASLPVAPTTRPMNTISPGDMARLDTILDDVANGRNPTITTTTGRSGTVSEVFRNANGRPTALQVNFTSDSGLTVSQRINLPSGGKKRKSKRMPKRKLISKKVGGYKSRKSRRRTFR